MRIQERHFIKLGYILFVLVAGGLGYYGRHYYFLPSAKKVRHALHPLLRQSGSLGHVLGILGTLFMILLLSYSMRKRLRFMKNWGRLETWLDVHIFLGFAGPVLVLFHTAFRFLGLVSISFWAMILVVISGIIGRYIYLMIPHSLSGMELSRVELEAEEIGLTYEIRKLIGRSHPLWDFIHELEHHHEGISMSRTLFLFVESIALRLELRKTLHNIPEMDSETRQNLKRILYKRQMLIKKMALIENAMKILHYWHLVHRPFVIIMFLVLVIHVSIAARMGYTWIF